MENYHRLKLAQELKSARFIDRMADESSLAYRRDARDYLEDLGGLKYAFDYIRSLPTNTVLDVGTGQGIALKGLKASSISRDLKLIGTAVKMNSGLSKNLGQGEYKITPIETLKGIPDQSCGGVISVFGGPMYSEQPRIVAESINRVLVNGGLTKNAFMLRGHENDDGMQYVIDKFLILFAALKDKGFDVTRGLVNSPGGAKIGVILGIKGAQKQTKLAEQLFYKDLETLPEQFSLVDP
jgi:ubiquinone/menaquinone biosynthesis C-methylase UbiE